MSPRSVFIQVTKKYSNKCNMSEQVMTDPLNEEESWDSDWNGQECDVNLLEPLVEISDNPKDKSKKRKKKTSNGESKKRGRQSLKNKNVGGVPTESIFVDVSIKQEPQESETLQDASLSGDPVATIPVGNSASPLPVYRVDSGDINAITHQLMLSPNTGNDSVQNAKKRRGRRSNKTKESNVVNMATGIKQENDKMANVFVMPFGADIETANNSTSEKSASTQSQVNESPSTEETTTKDRTSAITSNTGVQGSSPNRKLRDLTFKLVELNNKNLQCDSRIEKIKDEFKKRLQVAEIEKKGIEQEIDKVLATIQKWKDAK